MKKARITFVVLIMALQMFVVTTVSHAVSFDLGLYAFYAQWDPSFASQVDDYKSDPLLMVGPFLGVTFFEKLNFSALIIWGQADTSYTYEAESYDLSVQKADIDLSASYKLGDSFRITAGYKLSSYGEAEFEATSEGTSSLGSSNTLTGYALGLTYAMPLYGMLSLSVSDVVMYCRASGDSLETDYSGIGNNTTVNLAYFIEPLSTSIILGGRFQVIKYFEEDNAAKLDNEYFYGITIAAVWHI